MKKTIILVTILSLAFIADAVAQNTVQISGKVSDTDGMPLAGAAVFIKDTAVGTSTDENGTYQLSVPDNSVLVCSMIGMQTAEKRCSGSGIIDFVLEIETEYLEEVVAIGYGSVKKEEITSSITRVGSEDFIQGSVSNPLQLLQGKVAGLGISRTSGNPTGDISISLRGISTLAASSDPLIVIDGVAGCSLNSVSPEDIESINVLKDGSAAAIYGTRGTNGVIIINTKKPESGRVSIDYKGYVTIDKMIDETGNYPDASELRRYRAELSSTDERFELINDFGADTDWVKEVTRTPVSQTHYLSIQGGSSRTNYIASLTYNDRNGVFPGSFDEYVSAKINLNHSMFNDRLRIILNMSDKFDTQGFVPNDLYMQALSRNPTIPVYNEDGSWYENSNGANPVGLLKEASDINKYNQLMMSGKIEVEPVKNLILSATVNYLGDFNSREYSTTHKHYSAVMGSTKGQARLTDGHGVDKTLELQADYSKQLGRHSLSATVGYSYNKYEHQNSEMYGYDFPIDGFGAWNIGSANSTLDGTSKLTSYKYQVKLIGFYGRINYNYDNRYLLMVSLRREGSDKFGRNNRWGMFPAVSAGWRIKQEKFMQDVKWLSDLKLRAGYGVTGTAPSAAYQYISLYNFNSSYMGYDNGEWINAIIPTNNPNDDLKWERKQELNIGLDFGFFDGRLSGSVDYYERFTDDLLYTYNVPTPPNITNTILANVGSIRNSGVEVALSGIAIAKKDLTFSISGNFSYNTNELVSLSNSRYTMDYLALGSTGAPMQTYTHRLEAGWAVGNFYGWKINGLKNSTAWNVIGAENADPSEDHKTVIGNGIPKMFSALQFNLQWKGLDATVSFRGAFGFDILNAYRMKYETLAWLSSYNVPKAAYRKIGDYYNFASAIYSDYYIEKGDYVKLDNVTLGYTFDLTKVNNVIRNIRIFFSGMNLLTMTGYSGIDPEVSVTGLTPGVDPVEKYPNLRTYVMGLSFKF